MREMGGLTISTGDPGQMGTARKHEGYNFAVSVPDGEPADLLLYRSGSRKPEAEIPLPEAERTGQVSAVCVKGLEPGKWEYNYRIGGKAREREKSGEAFWNLRRRLWSGLWRFPTRTA